MVMAQLILIVLASKQKVVGRVEVEYIYYKV